MQFMKIMKFCFADKGDVKVVFGDSSNSSLLGRVIIKLTLIEAIFREL